MAFVIADRVRETTTTTGTGSVTLAGAYISFQSFSAAIGNGNSTYYTIANPSAGEWEVGIGTYTSGTNTLSRDTVLASSASGAKVTLSSGSKDVFVTQPAERSLLVQSAGSGLFAGNAAFTANGVLYADSTTTTATGSTLTFNGTTLSTNGLTATGTTTLSGGTANGVAYLNGSKVVTTGSALTFDGTNLAATGSISTTISSKTAQFNAAGGSIYAQFADGTTTWRLGTGIQAAGQFNLYDVTNAQTALTFVPGASGYTAFLQNNSEQMRLTSTGLGIGTSSPGAKLNTAIAAGAASSTNIHYLLSETGTNSDTGMQIKAINSTNSWDAGAITFRREGSANSYGLVFATSSGGTNNNRMTLDSSGNLGLGVTPNAGTSGRVFQITNAGHFMASGSTVYIDANAYFDSGWKYITSAAASNYYQNSGAHIWQTAASGTAGNAITFTQAMTLDASGNLLVGATSTQLGERVNVTGAGILIQSSAATNRGLLGNFGGSDFVVGTYDSFALTFRTGNTERARITSGGYFKASNSGSYDGPTETCHELYQTANNNTVKISSTNASLTTDGVALFLVNRNTTNNTFYALSYYNIGAGAYKFRVADSGNVTNTNGSYGTISDVKMKTDIMDAGSQWADIKAIKFRKFKMKDDPEQVVQLGVVAQEIEQTSPGLVEEHTDRDADGNDLGTTTKSVKTSVLLMKAAVALQEAMARIEQLEADVAALKGN